MDEKVVRERIATLFRLDERSMRTSLASWKLKNRELQDMLGVLRRRYTGPKIELEDQVVTHLINYRTLEGIYPTPNDYLGYWDAIKK